MTFINEILEYADQYSMFPASGIVLAAVSGGADSMCLLSILSQISQIRGFKVEVLHYNHMLRDGESERDEAFVRDRCEAIGMTCHVEYGDVKAAAGRNKLGIEETARIMRYDFFYEQAEKLGAVRIATAHTSDDNAETIIMNLTRGAGTTGLGGIPPVRGIIIRPMLCVSRDEIIKDLKSRNTGYVEDSSNAQLVYTRNKIRSTVMPVLKEINPRFTEAAFFAASICRADDEYLSHKADEFLKTQERSDAVNVKALLSLPTALASRVVRKLFGGSLSFLHVKAVLELCGNDDPSACLSLPGVIVYREYCDIVFEKSNDRRSGEIISINDESTLNTYGFNPVNPEDGFTDIIIGTEFKLTCKTIIFDDTINRSLTNFLFNNAELCGKITVRPRREADRIRLFGRVGTKTLKKLFIEKRIPARKRALIPVVADDAGVLAVCGIGRSDRAIPNPGEPAIMIMFERI